ncbi:MAG: GntR family transcriptional regulator [Butyrivibrio sp.]|nr:GntR family transcriptional regulator [Butyrivibrio sp.]
MSLTPIKKNTTLKEQAYEQIREAINTNSLKPGTFLTEEQLSNMLSISRTPIRSALQQLVYEKLLSQDATGHIYVSKITEKNVTDASKVRIALECMALDCTDFPLSEEKLTYLEDIYNKQLLLANDNPNDNLGFAELDKQFHCSLAECCDNSLLIEFIQSINNAMVRMNVLSGTLHNNRKEALKEHAQILQYLKSSQKEFAKLSLSEHLKHVEKRMIRRQQGEII